MYGNKIINAWCAECIHDGNKSYIHCFKCLTNTLNNNGIDVPKPDKFVEDD